MDDDEPLIRADPKWRKVVEKLKAENAKLRGALENIWTSSFDTRAQLREIARAALQKDEEECQN